jgi:hypothetical protein
VRPVAVRPVAVRSAAVPAVRPPVAPAAAAPAVPAPWTQALTRRPRLAGPAGMKARPVCAQGLNCSMPCMAVFLLAQTSPVHPPTHPPSPSLPTTRLRTWLGMKRTPGDEIHHHFNLLWRQDSLGCSKIQHLAQELEHFWCCHRRQLCPHARRRRPAAFFCAGVHEGVAESLPRCRHAVVSDKHNLVGISGLDADNHAQGWMRSDHAIEPLLKGAEVFVLLLGSASNQPAGSAARRGRLAITAGCVRAASGAHSNYSTKWMCGS